VLAAPGLLALRDGPAGMIERLAEDHANARRLAEGLAGLPGVVDLDVQRVRTNFVFFRVHAARDDMPAAALAPRELRARFLATLAQAGVLMIDYPHGQVRAVTHYGVERSDVERVLVAVRRALVEIGAAAMPVAA